MITEMMKRIPRAVSVAIVLVALTFCVVWLLRSCAQLPGGAVRAAGEPAVDLARRIADGVARRVQVRPEVRIDRETVLAGETPVLELVTVRREFAHEYEWEHRWLGSTKRLRLRGTFEAKAGFDLQEGFLLEVDSRDLRVGAELPAPQVLGVELIGYEAREEEGLWNKLSAEERTEAVNALLASARASAERDRALTAEARRMLEAQLGEIVTEGGGIFRGEGVRD